MFRSALGSHSEVLMGFWDEIKDQTQPYILAMGASGFLYDQWQMPFREIRTPPSRLNCTRLISLTNVATAPQHSYRDLRGKDEIRLLILSPGEQGSPLRGVVFHTSIMSAEKYRALSYV
jgi:hypothetical protein